MPKNVLLIAAMTNEVKSKIIFNNFILLLLSDLFVLKLVLLFWLFISTHVLNDIGLFQLFLLHTCPESVELLFIQKQQPRQFSIDVEWTLNERHMDVEWTLNERRMDV